LPSQLATTSEAVARSIARVAILHKSDAQQHSGKGGNVRDGYMHISISSHHDLPHLAYEGAPEAVQRRSVPVARTNHTGCVSVLLEQHKIASMHLLSICDGHGSLGMPVSMGSIGIGPGDVASSRTRPPLLGRYGRRVIFRPCAAVGLQVWERPTENHLEQSRQKWDFLRSTCGFPSSQRGLSWSDKAGLLASVVVQST
jgi:hypothetical protein